MHGSNGTPNYWYWREATDKPPPLPLPPPPQPWKGREEGRAVVSVLFITFLAFLLYQDVQIIRARKTVFFSSKKILRIFGFFVELLCKRNFCKQYGIIF